MLNNISMVGRVTKDPELRFTPTNVPVCTFTIACERDYKNAKGEKDVDFIDIVAWRKLAENSAKYLFKGSAVAINGSLQTRTYEKDGTKRKVYEIFANCVQFLTPKPAIQNSENTSNEDLPYREE